MLLMWSLLRSLCHCGGCGWALSWQFQGGHETTTHVLLRAGLNDYQFFLFQVVQAHPQQIMWFVWFRGLLDSELPAQRTTTTTTTTTWWPQQRPHQQQQWLRVINGKPPWEVFFLKFFMLCLFFVLAMTITLITSRTTTTVKTTHQPHQPSPNSLNMSKWQWHQ